VTTGAGREILIIAGEASGDLHAAALVDGMRRLRPDLSFYGIGGDKMAGAGVTLLRHARDMAFLGFFEVVRHLPFIRGVLAEIRGCLERRRPACVILVDYPGFNLRVAASAKRLGIPVLYYVSPQVWAWGRGRVRKIAATVDRMLVLFDFEAPIYREAGLDAVFTGHPLRDLVRPSETRAEFFRRAGLDPGRPLLALLPGSRRQEIERLLPAMAGAAGRLARDVPGLQAVVGLAPMLPDAVYAPVLSRNPGLRAVRGRSYEVMAFSDAALVASGTATLETALSGAPMVILYRMSPLSFAIGKLLVRTEHVGLVNIVAGRRVVPELLQGDVTPAKIRDAALPLLTDPERRRAVREALAETAGRLGPPGAAERAAESAVEFLEARGAAPAA
jgi:lipid-A-disaccharide synthase